MTQEQVTGGRWLDAVVGRTLVFVVLTGVVVTIYAIGFGLVGQRVVTNTALGVLLGAVIAAVLQPAYFWARRGVDWLLFGDRGDPYRAIVRTANRLETRDSRRGVVEALLDSARVALRLTHAAVRAIDAPPTALPAGRVYQFPLRYQDEQVGILEVSRGRDPLTSGDRRLLAGVQPLLAAALDATRRGEQLQAMRERLVVVHEEERRRLRRDLHDGLGPELAAASLSIDAARVRLRQDVDAADDTLAAVQVQLRAAVVEMRRLIDALRPSALEQFGLVSAVRQQIAALCPDGVRTCVTTTGDGGDLPAAVEVAAYRIAVEAATNALRHAGCSHCTVEFARVGQEWSVTVTDDGTGRGDRLPGVGTRSMIERAEEIGGRVEFSDVDSGGTQVVARLPVHVGQATAATDSPRDTSRHAPW